ncbi:MAG: ECF transporter S component [Oscillospiraceae bacterium]|nr:ECF transporter S component [Oscillospiraceae bacterium]
MKKTKTLKLAQLALLVAIVLVMAYTPLGYLRTLGLEISFLMIPVTIGAIVLGPVEGAILGLVFGLTSFATCFGSSPFGVTLLAINPVFTFITCVVARVLAGFLAGIVFKVVKKLKFGYEVASLAGPLLNTFFFMGCLVLFFYNTEFIQNLVVTLGVANPFAFVIAFVGLQGLVEAVACCVIAAIISKNIDKFVNR